MQSGHSEPTESLHIILHLEQTLNELYRFFEIRDISVFVTRSGHASNTSDRGGGSHLVWQPKTPQNNQKGATVGATV